MSRSTSPAPDCPLCGRPVAASLPRSCDGCGTLFRWVPMAALMSIALPGWGHFYLGRRILAAFELAGAVVLFAAALVRLGIVFLAVLAERAAPLALLWACLPWAFVLVSYSVADGAFTLLVSRHRLVPAGTLEVDR